MKTNLPFLSYLPQLFLEIEIFHQKLCRKSKHTISILVEWERVVKWGFGLRESIIYIGKTDKHGTIYV